MFTDINLWSVEGHQVKGWKVQGERRAIMYSVVRKTKRLLLCCWC